MASFLGASTAGTGLVTFSTQISVATTAAQIIATPPQRFQPLYAVLRAPNVALSATTSFKVGVTTALFQIVATTVATSLPTTASQVIATFTSGATTNAPVAATANVYFSAVQVDPTAVTAYIDLVGYIS